MYAYLNAILYHEIPKQTCPSRSCKAAVLKTVQLQPLPSIQLNLNNALQGLGCKAIYFALHSFTFFYWHASPGEPQSLNGYLQIKRFTVWILPLPRTLDGTRSLSPPSTIWWRSWPNLQSCRKDYKMTYVKLVNAQNSAVQIPSVTTPSNIFRQEYCRNRTEQQQVLGCLREVCRRKTERRVKLLPSPQRIQKTLAKENWKSGIIIIIKFP